MAHWLPTGCQSNEMNNRMQITRLSGWLYIDWWIVRPTLIFASCNMTAPKGGRRGGKWRARFSRSCQYWKTDFCFLFLLSVVVSPIKSYCLSGCLPAERTIHDEGGRRINQTSVGSEREYGVSSLTLYQRQTNNTNTNKTIAKKNKTNNERGGLDLLASQHNVLLFFHRIVLMEIILWQILLC